MSLESIFSEGEAIFVHLLGHFKTVVRHRHKVFIHCVKAGIPIRGLLHDLSKFSPTEFIPGAKYYQGNRSPNEREREVYGYSAAWMHHKGRNRHHYEYWTDYNPTTRKIEAVKMPRKFVAEMFCDRVAASKIYRGKDYADGDALAYFLKGRAPVTMHPETAAELREMLTVLAEQGEDAAFAYVKAYLKEENKK
ncbi:MAG: DUF5662 family protein [Eubacteriales bacterium]